MVSWIGRFGSILCFNDKDEINQQNQNEIEMIDHDVIQSFFKNMPKSKHINQY